ncbi:MAG: hypothetical protein ACTHOH_14605, partial [Lysobacteraceae bacterium]
DAPPASSSLPSTSYDPEAGTPGKTAKGSEFEAMLAAVASKPIIGRRMDLRYRMPAKAGGEPVPTYSRGYLFHRQLYYVKGRISAPESKIDQATFESLADRTMRSLVPAIVVSNIGGCSQTSISIDPNTMDEGGSVGDLLLQIIGGSDAGIERHCFDSRDEAIEEEPKDATIVVIDYDPSDWGETP